MQKYRASALNRATLLLGASATALLITTPALAKAAQQPAPPPTDQTPPARNPQSAAQTPPKTQVPSSGGDAALTSDQRNIVVTGTRIRQPEFTSPDPVARIDPVIAKESGKLDTADMLQSSPIAAGSTQITSALSSNFVTNGGPGAETIDLRGLGPNRTLVLLNGRRAGPAGTRGGVSSFDLNVLPQSIVERVDILKTGASSIYGSDAVAGVVNLITKTDFNGLEIDGFANVPTKKGGEVFSGSVLWGKSNDRGHIMVALDYYKQNELARGDRSYLSARPPTFSQRHAQSRGPHRSPHRKVSTAKTCRSDRSGRTTTNITISVAQGNLHLGKRDLRRSRQPNAISSIRASNSDCRQFGLRSLPGNCFSAPPGWYPDRL